MAVVVHGLSLLIACGDPETIADAEQMAASPDPVHAEAGKLARVAADCLLADDAGRHAALEKYVAIVKAVDPADTIEAMDWLMWLPVASREQSKWRHEQVIALIPDAPCAKIMARNDESAARWWPS